MSLKIVKTKPKKQLTRSEELLLEAEEIIAKDKFFQQREKNMRNSKQVEEYKRFIQTHKRDHRPSRYKIGKSPGSYR